MYTQVASKLILDASTNPVEHSQAVSLDGQNTLNVDIEVYSGSSGGGAGLTVTPQLSNDLQNWTDITGGTPSAGTASAPAYLEIAASGLNLTAAAYCRLKYEVAAGGIYALAAGISTANL